MLFSAHVSQMISSIQISWIKFYIHLSCHMCFMPCPFPTPTDISVYEPIDSTSILILGIGKTDTYFRIWFLGCKVTTAHFSDLLSYEVFF